MELIKKRSTYILVIGGHAIRLTKVDLRQLVDLAADNLREAEELAADISLYQQIKELRPHGRLVVKERRYTYDTIRGICSMIKRRHGTALFTTKLKESGDIVVYRR